MSDTTRGYGILLPDGGTVCAEFKDGNTDTIHLVYEPETGTGFRLQLTHDAARATARLIAMLLEEKQPAGAGGDETI
jgi:hypothetical protein